MTNIHPIVVSVVLAAPPERAFTAFADEFGHWWPVATHSLSRHAATRCRLDANLGGAGREAHTAQWVDIEFTPLDAGTRVTLTHGGWDALGEIAPILRREYVSGWENILGKIYADFVHRNS